MSCDIWVNLRMFVKDPMFSCGRGCPISDLGLKWIILATNGTNLRLFKIKFQYILWNPSTQNLKSLSWSLTPSVSIDWLGIRFVRPNSLSLLHGTYRVSVWWCISFTNWKHLSNSYSSAVMMLIQKSQFTNLSLP